ncbi:MAG: M12 family metallopeptidase [Legionellales bacterium]|nr:M12 family metallopeptidase [Legionellales bacterium]
MPILFDLIQQDKTTDHPERNQRSPAHSTISHSRRHHWCGMLLSLFLTAPSFADSELGHLSVRDPQYGIRDIIYTAQDGYAVTEGDIMLTALPKSSKHSSGSRRPPPQAMILLKLGGFRWPDAIVPFQFSPNLPPKNQLAILDAMQNWEKVTKVRFVELSQSNAEKYSDYLLFTPTDNLKCSSYVGRQGGPQIIILGPNCATMNVAHELGHALGLWHEQSRKDRDQYIRILWENIDEDYRYNFNQHINDGEDFGNYDYQSIMHYTAYAFSKNGQPTIIPIEEGVMIGQRKQLSAKDIAAVNAMYP